MLNDDNKLKMRYNNKKANAKKEGIDFNLTYEEFCYLLEDAGLVSSDLGIKSFHLARFNDEGNYSIGNCRFVWYLTNLQEKKNSEKNRLTSSINLTRYNKSEQAKINRSLRSKSPSEATIKYIKKIKDEALLNRMKYEDTAHKSYLNEKNSQFGTFWITNGEQNIKWSSSKGPLPLDFYKGRVTNK